MIIPDYFYRFSDYFNKTWVSYNAHDVHDVQARGAKKQNIRARGGAPQTYKSETYTFDLQLQTRWFRRDVWNL